MMKQRKILHAAAIFLLCLLSLLGLTACGKKAQKNDLWAEATYTEDTELGNGSSAFAVEVEVEEKTVKFTVHTDQKIVGDALTENGLIAGEEAQYGLYVKQVNGITADYDIDHSYWAFYINGELASAGVDSTEIDENAVYKLVYTK